MKYVLLSIFMVLSIAVSIPSVNVNADECEIENDNQIYEAVLSDFDNVPNISDTNAVQLPLLPTPKPLDVKRLYLKHYFNGLTENFGENAKGSCTYVALCMLLSYYDSYLCDDIIPEQFDVASNGYSTDMIGRNNYPGTVNDKILNNVSDEDYQNYIDSLTKIEYYNILKEKFGSNSLQVYLMDLADTNNIQKIDNGKETFGSNFVYAFNVLEKYFDSLGFTRGKEYDLPYLQYNSVKDVNKVKQFIIDNIDMGRPVFVCGTGIMGGHAFICYDYDSINSISAHWGWHDISYINQDPFLFFGDKIDAMVIDFRFEHTHSYNYMVGDKAYCFCDDEIATYHNHSYTTSISLNKKQHRSYCECGKYMDGPHWIRGSVSKTKCAACGAILDPNEPVIGIWSIGKTPNGSYISQSGIPVIMEADVEAYLSGTLKFGTGISNYDFI